MRGSITSTGFLAVIFFTFGIVAGGALEAHERKPCQTFELIRQHRLGPGEPLFGHVQGLEVSDEFFFLSAVTMTGETAFLYIYPRHGGEGRPPLWQHDLWGTARKFAGACGRLDSETLNHPSGLYLEADRLHVAIAPSADTGPSCVMVLDVRDPSALVVERATRVEDHIGALIRLPDAVIGFSWASDDYWRWEESGILRRLPAQEDLHGELVERLHLQDCDREGDLVYCGHSNHRDDLVKVYPLTAFGPEPSSLRPLAIGLPAIGSKQGGTHEGLAVLHGRLFLLPDDGDASGVSLYELRCHELDDQ